MPTVQPQPSYLVLEPGKTYRLRFKGARQEDRPITDPVTRQQKIVNVYVLEVSEVNGEARATTLSLTALKVQNLLTPLINSGEAFRRVVEITRRGVGYATEYEVRTL